jgi:hypothetical protein
MLETSGTPPVMRELMDQGVQATLLIHDGSIVLHKNNRTLNYNSEQKGMATVRTITSQDKRNVWKDNKVSRQQDNKNREKQMKVYTIEEQDNSSLLYYKVDKMSKII